MSKRGIKLARFRRMLGGGVSAEGVTRVHRRSTADTPPPDGTNLPEAGEESTATTAGESVGADESHGRRRTVAGFGFYKGVHRQGEAA